MSADNYGVCPNCINKIKNKVEYGKASKEEYDVYTKGLIHITKEESLREYYEVYINEEGDFILDFFASCDECGFEYKKEIKEKVIK